MKAMVINKFGSFDVFEQMDTMEPELKKGCVMVKVLASSLNPIEIK